MRLKNFKTIEKAAAAVGLTVPEMEMVHDCASMVLSEIIFDVLGGEEGSIRRYSAIEVVCDADRLIEQVRRWAGPNSRPPLDAEAIVSKLRAASLENLYSAVGFRLSARSYCI